MNKKWFLFFSVFLVIIFLYISLIPFEIYRNIALSFLPGEKVFTFRFEYLVFSLKMKSCIFSLLIGVLFSIIYLFYDKFFCYIRTSFRNMKSDVLLIKDDIYNILKRFNLYDFVFTGFIFIIYIILRIFIFGKHLTYDEAYTFYHYAIKPIYYALTSYTLPNNHFFNTLMIHLFFRIFGYSMITIKLPAFLFSILLFFIILFIFSSLFGKYVSFLSIVFITFSPDLVAFSTFGRGYIYAITFGIMALFFLEKFMKKEINSSFWYGIFIALSLYSLPSFIIIFVAYHVYVFIVYKDRKDNIELIIWALFFTIILFLPVYIVSGFEMVSSHTSAQVIGIKHINRLIPYLYHFIEVLSFDFYMPVSIFIVLSVIIAILLRNRISLIILSILFSFILIMIVNNLKLFPYRTILLFLPYFYLLFSAFLEKIFNKAFYLIIVLLVLFMGVSFYYLPDNIKIKSNLYGFEVGIKEMRHAIDLSVNNNAKLFAWGEESIKFIAKVFYNRDDIPSNKKPQEKDLIIFGREYDGKIEDILRRYDPKIIYVKTDTVFINNYSVISRIKEIKH